MLITDNHWRRSALNSAGAFPENFGKFSPIHILYYKIPDGGQKCRGARSPPEPPRTAPLLITKYILSQKVFKWSTLGIFHIKHYKQLLISTKAYNYRCILLAIILPNKVSIDETHAVIRCPLFFSDAVYSVLLFTSCICSL